MAVSQYSGWGKQAAQRSEMATVELSRFVRAMTELKTLNYTSQADRKRGLDTITAMEREKSPWGRRTRFPAAVNYYVEVGQEPWCTAIMHLKISLVADGAAMTAESVAEYYRAVTHVVGLLRDNSNVIDRGNAEKQLRLRWTD